MTRVTLFAGRVGRSATWSGLLGVMTLNPAAMVRFSFSWRSPAQPTPMAKRAMAPRLLMEVTRCFIMTMDWFWLVGFYFSLEQICSDGVEAMPFPRVVVNPSPVTI